MIWFSFQYGSVSRLVRFWFGLRMVQFIAWLYLVLVYKMVQFLAWLHTVLVYRVVWLLAWLFLVQFIRWFGF